MDKTIFTSGNYAFEAFDEDGILYSAQRIQEYYILKVSDISANQTKTVRLDHPSIDFDLECKQIRLNKGVTGDITVTIDVYRGNDYIEHITFDQSQLPFTFAEGTIIDPHRSNTNLDPVELRITANKAINELFLICGKCYLYPMLELLDSY